MKNDGIKNPIIEPMAIDRLPKTVESVLSFTPNQRVDSLVDDI